MRFHTEFNHPHSIQIRGYVVGLRKIRNVDVFVQPILLDIVRIVTAFDVIIVSKVPKYEVRDAHALAKNVRLS